MNRSALTIAVGLLLTLSVSCSSGDVATGENLPATGTAPQDDVSTTSDAPPPTENPADAPTATEPEDDIEISPYWWELPLGTCVFEIIGDQPEAIDCAEPHGGELYALPEIGTSEWPGWDHIDTTLRDACLAAAHPDGIPGIQVGIISPGEEQWQLGARTGACWYMTEDGTALTGPIDDYISGSVDS